MNTGRLLKDSTALLVFSLAFYILQKIYIFGNIIFKNWDVISAVQNIKLASSQTIQFTTSGSFVDTSHKILFILLLLILFGCLNYVSELEYDNSFPGLNREQPFQATIFDRIFGILLHLLVTFLLIIVIYKYWYFGSWFKVYGSYWSFVRYLLELMGLIGLSTFFLKLYTFDNEKTSN